MGQTQELGQIIILNGAPRSGKSSIVAVIQETFDGLWMNLGVDRFMQMTPARYLPGIGLRPGSCTIPAWDRSTARGRTPGPRTLRSHSVQRHV